MADITSQLAVTETPRTLPTDIYSRAGIVGQVGDFLKDLLPTGRVVNSGTLTASSGKITIPLGTVFLIAVGNTLYKLKNAAAIVSDALADTNHLYISAGFFGQADPAAGNSVTSTQGAATGAADYATVKNPTVKNAGALTILLGFGATVPSGALDLGTYATSGDLFTEAATLNASVSFAGDAILSTTISSAQILALFTTAIQVVPAPPAGFAIDVLDCTVTFNPVTTAYTLGSATNLSLNFTDKSGAALSGTQTVTGLIDGATKVTAKIPALGVILTNAAKVVLKLAGGNPTLGDGTLTVTVRYQVV